MLDWMGLGGVGLRLHVFVFVWVCCGSDIDGLVVFGLGSLRLALVLSFVMRLSCLVSDLVIGGCSLVLV